jgi:hypothetical protein
MKNKIEPEIEKTLQSLDGLKRVELSPLMADRIFRKAMETTPIEHQEKVSALPIGWVVGIAAVFIINFSFLFWMNQVESQNNQPETLTELYFDSEINY